MQGPARQPMATAKYRINRRAAFFVSGLFLAIGGLFALLLVVRHDPERQLQFLRRSADGYLRDAQWDQAAIQLTNLVRLSPEDSAAWYELGMAQLQLAKSATSENNSGPSPRRTNRLRAAVACLRRVVELEPNHQPALRWLLEFDLRGGNWEDARARLAAVDPLPGDRLAVLAWELLPTAYPDLAEQARRELEQGRDQEVVAALEPVLRETPADFALLESCALALTALGQLDRREALFAAVTQRLGPSARLAYVRGRCALEQNDDATAQRYLRESAAAPHLEQASRHLLAEIALRRANAQRTPDDKPAFEEALAHYRAILELDPNDDRAVNNAVWILGKELGRTDQAVSLSEQWLARNPDSSPVLAATLVTVSENASRQGPIVAPSRSAPEEQP